MNHKITFILLLLISSFFLIGCTQPDQKEVTPEPTPNSHILRGHTYLSEITFTPFSTVGNQGQLYMTLKDPKGNPIQGFVEGDNRNFEIFIFSMDLSYFFHIGIDDFSGIGEEDLKKTFFRMGVEFPKDGKYKIYLDHTNNSDRIIEQFDVDSGGLNIPQDGTPQKNFSVEQNIDGYTVLLKKAPVLKSGTPLTLTFDIEKEGVKVTDLGSLRGEKIFVTVVDEEVGSFGRATKQLEINSFTHTFPAPGDYKIFVEFRHQGATKTVSFWVNVESLITIN
ncbi:hypothetical protein CMO92_00680 [Candidatus Woesearchaeota archaeon]|nr:hypothetical protein [Candidatus Woesearchaeota archaeon]